MKRPIRTALLLALLCTGGTASAQFQPPAAPNYGPGYRPQLSPYLNFLRGGDPAANYYLGTLPEIQRRYEAQQFSTGISDLDRRVFGISPVEDTRLFTPLPGTGHPTTFGNTLTYFGTSNPYARQRAGTTTGGRTTSAIGGGAPGMGSGSTPAGQQQPRPYP